MERNGGGLWQPGQTAMAVAHIKPDGVDFASSVGVVSQVNGGAAQVFAVGGFTQLEALAVALAPLAMKWQTEACMDVESNAREAGFTAANWAKEMMAGIKEGLAK